MQWRELIGRPLTRRLLLSIVLFSSAVTLVTTAIQLYTEYERDIGAVESEIEQVRASFVGSLEASRWALNDEQTLLLVDGIAQLRDVRRVFIRERGEISFDRGTGEGGAAREFTIPLEWTHAGQTISLGTLVITVDLAAIYGRLLDRIWIILSTNAVKTLLVVVFVLLLFHQLLTRHLLRISAYLQGLTAESLDRPLSLDRSEDASRNDELTEVVSALNGMREGLSQSYRALATSEALMRQLAENIDVVLWVGSPDWRRVIYVSPGYERVWGRSAGELLRDPVAWLEAIHPDDQAKVRRTVDRGPSAFAGSHPEAHASLTFPDYRVVREDGTTRWISARAFPVWDDDGTLLRVVGISEDITERREKDLALQASESAAQQARQRLMDAIETIPASFSLFDADDRLELSNSQTAAFFPELQPLLVSGTSFEAFVRRMAESGSVLALASSREWVPLKEGIEPWIRARQRHHRDPSEDLEMERADGRRYSILERKTSDGGTVILHVDVTRRQEAESQLAQAQKMEAVGQLTGGVAHDFNNLLGVIMGNLELLQDLDDNARQSELIVRAMHAAERGAGLTNRLLAFARKQPLQPSNVELGPLLHDMIELLQRTLGEQVAVEVAVAGGLWPCFCDPSQLESAILNLAINARDAMPEGGKLTIEAYNARLDEDYAAREAEVSPGQYVVVAVSDTGSGIPEEIRSRIFDPFFTSKEMGKGSGLGLSMVYGFVKQSGGHVTVYSEPGKGATFKLYLPRSRDTAKSAGDSPALCAPEVGSGELILVAEDDEDLSQVVAVMLTGLGYRVVTAQSGEEALRAFEAEDAIDLLVTDVVLGSEMSGKLLVDAVRARRPDTPVLYMSGYTENAIIHHGRLDPGIALLQKPFRREELARAVRRAINRRPAQA